MIFDNFTNTFKKKIGYCLITDLEMTQERNLGKLVAFVLNFMLAIFLTPPVQELHDHNSVLWKKPIWRR